MTRSFHGSWLSDFPVRKEQGKRSAAWLLAFEPLLILAVAPVLWFAPRWPEIAVIASLLVPLPWLLRWRLRGALTVRTPFDGAVLVVLLATCAGSLVVLDWDRGIPKIYGIVLGVALLYSLANSIGSQRSLVAASGVFVLAGLALAAIALVGTEWYESKFPVLEPVYARLPVLVRGVVPGTAAGGINPNEAAGAILFPLLVGMGLLLSNRRAIPSRAFLVLACAVMLGVLVLTQSRSAYAGLAAGSLATAGLLLVRRRGLPPALLMGAAGVGMALLSLSVWAPVVQGAGDPRLPRELGTLEGRLAIWQVSLRMIGDFPYTGIGPGQFRPVLHALYGGAGFGPTALVPHAHNFVLQTALDLGVPGLVAIGALLAAFFRECWGLSKSEGPRAGIGVGLLAAMVAFLVFGTTDTIAIGARGGIVFWATLGLAAAARRVAGNPRVTAASPGAGPASLQRSSTR